VENRGGVKNRAKRVQIFHTFSGAAIFPPGAVDSGAAARSALECGGLTPLSEWPVGRKMFFEARNTKAADPEETGLRYTAPRLFSCRARRFLLTADAGPLYSITERHKSATLTRCSGAL